MKRMTLFVVLFAGCWFVPSQLQAQIPTIDGALNSGSYARPGLPNAGIAQGSIFSIFGNNMGPTTPVLATGFPLLTTIGQPPTSVAVTIGSTTVSALMIAATKTQLTVVLPSNTPAGTGTFRVTYNGQTSATAAITVVVRSVGIFTLNQAGSGPGVVQNVNTQTDQPINSATRPARPQQLMILWATGIGPVTVQGSEANGAGLGVDMTNINLHVFVGGQEASVAYRGRGCCVGLDQIAFTVPAGLQGCSVPVYVVADGVVSNFASIAVAASGNTCGDSNYSSSDIETATANGGLRVATLSVQRFFLRTIGIPSILASRLDSLGGTYGKVPLETILASQGSAPIGSCTVLPIPAPLLPNTTPLNTGITTVTGPVGTRVLEKSNVGTHYMLFAPGQQFPPVGYVTDGTLITAGTYNFNVTAGTEVGAHTGTVNHPATFTWTEFETITTNVPRSQGLAFHWTGGSPGGIVVLQGQSQSAPGIGAYFYCYADAMAGSFTVPAAILSAMPTPYAPYAGSLSVVNAVLGSSFSIPGIDKAYGGAFDGYNVGPINFQ